MVDVYSENKLDKLHGRLVHRGGTIFRWRGNCCMADTTREIQALEQLEPLRPATAFDPSGLWATVEFFSLEL